jgi:hypothetical protein
MTVVMSGVIATSVFLVESAGTFRFVDFKVNTCVVFCTDDTEQRAKALRSLPLASDDLSKVFRIYFQSNEYAHFIDGSVTDDIVWVINHRFHDVFYKLSILVFHTFLQLVVPIPIARQLGHIGVNGLI